MGRAAAATRILAGTAKFPLASTESQTMSSAAQRSIHRRRTPLPGQSAAPGDPPASAIRQPGRCQAILRLAGYLPDLFRVWPR